MERKYTTTKSAKILRMTIEQFTDCRKRLNIAGEKNIGTEGVTCTLYTEGQLRYMYLYLKGQWPKANE